MKMMKMTWNAYLKEIDRAYSLPPREGEARLLELEKTCREDFGADSAFFASMRNEVGAFYKGLGRFEVAEACFRDALALFRQRLGRSDPACATALNNLAGTHRLAGRLDEAEQEFQDCVALYGETVGKDHVLYASGLNNLSLVALDRGELARAAALQEQAAAILRHHPEAREELSVSLINLGVLYQRLEQWTASEGKLAEALRMLQEELGTDTPHYHAARNALGTLYYAQGRWKAAEGEFLAAAEAAEAMYGPDHYEAKSSRAHAAKARERMEAGG